MKEDPVMSRIHAICKAKPMTQQELGEKMGYEPESARKSVSQFLKSGDPRISTLRRFARAMKMKLADLVK